MFYAMALFMAVAAVIALFGLRGGVQQATGAEARPAALGGRDGGGQPWAKSPWARHGPTGL